MTNFPLTTPSLTALVIALKAPHQVNDKAAQEILKRVQEWSKMLARLERDDWTWLDGVLDRQIKLLLSEAQAGTPLSYYLANGQFSSGFAIVQGLIRAEIANKRKEFEKLAEARANQTVVEAEKVSVAFAQIPALEATLLGISQSSQRAEANELKSADALEELESSKSSGAGLVEELTTLLEEAKTQIAEAVAQVNTSTLSARQSATNQIFEFESDVEGAKTAAIQAKESALKAQSDAEQADSAIQKLLVQLGKKSEASLLRVEASNDAIDQKIVELKEATLQLQTAKADLNRQGLADAFATHATKLTESRKWVDRGFYWTLGVGACYVAACAWYGNVSTWALWLQKLSPLGVLAWICWTLASRSNVLSRLIEDYEFKAATALAFQGYRSEMGSNKELLDKLLDKAIANFGSNPTRLMPQAKSQHAHPLESVVDKTSALSKEVFDGIKTFKS